MNDRLDPRAKAQIDSIIRSAMQPLDQEPFRGVDVSDNTAYELASMVDQCTQALVAQATLKVQAFENAMGIMADGQMKNMFLRWQEDIKTLTEVIESYADAAPKLCDRTFDQLGTMAAGQFIHNAQEDVADLLPQDTSFLMISWGENRKVCANLFNKTDSQEASDELVDALSSRMEDILQIVVDCLHPDSQNKIKLTTMMDVEENEEGDRRVIIDATRLTNGENN